MTKKKPAAKSKAGRKPKGLTKRVQFSITLPPLLKKMAEEESVNYPSLAEYFEYTIVKDLREKGKDLSKVYPVQLG
jgi:hypothetical protein